MKMSFLLFTIFLGSMAWSQTQVVELPESFAGKYQFVDSYYRTSPSKCPAEIKIAITSHAGRTISITSQPVGLNKSLNQAMSLIMQPDKVLQNPLNDKKYYIKSTSKITFNANTDYPELSYFEAREKRTTFKKYLLMDVTQDSYDNSLLFILNKNQSSTLSIKIYERAINHEQQMEMCNYQKP